MRSSVKKVLALTALLAGFASGPSHAASLNTDVDVTLPSVIALYCYDKVDVNVTPEGFLAALVRPNANNPATLTRNARGRNGRWIVRAPRNRFNQRRFQLRDRVNLTMTGVCALRALSGTSGIRVRIDAQETSLVTPSGSSSIELSRIRARDGANGGGWRRRYNLPVADLGIGVVRDIDIRMRLDLRNANEAGTYSSTTDGTFLVTVIARP